MGTILAEAYMTSWSVMGSDVSADIVDRAKKNLDWLVQLFPGTRGSIGACVTADAVHISEHIVANSVDAIVTEPFMGATSIANQKTLDSQKIKNIIKGLEKLYIGCLRDWHKILKENGRIVIALPAYAVLGRVYFVKKVVDMCENLGYTIVDGPIEYSRPQAIVKRQFYILQKKN
jgi:tRNA G10  N-methylase Trm11